ALHVIVTPLLRSDPSVIALCYVLGISSAARAYLLTIRGLLQGLGRFDLETMMVVADRVLLLLVGGGALWGGFGLSGLAVAFVLVRLTMLGAALILLHRVIGTARPSFDRMMWR